MTGVRLDIQTYIKVIVSLYKETPTPSPALDSMSQHLSNLEKKQVLELVNLLFKRDCSDQKDYDFGCEILFS